MKRIYLLGVILILFISLGAVFYVEANNFHVYAYIVKESITQSGYQVYSICVVSSNKGPLPMSANVIVAISAGTQSGIFAHTKNYINDTSISVAPFSSKKLLVNISIPAAQQVYNVYIEGSGNYNWQLKPQNNITLNQQIYQLNTIAHFYPIRAVVSSKYLTFYTNASIIFTNSHAYPYYVQSAPISLTAYPNGSIIYSIAFVLNTQYIKLSSGSYTAKLYVNGSLVNTSSITISQGQQVVIYGNLPPSNIISVQNYDTTYNITLFLNGQQLIYYFGEIISI
jgi:hypothetical protein